MMELPPTLAELHREARDRLKKAGVDDPALEARILVEHLTQTTQTDMITAPGSAVNAGQVQAVRAAVARRAGGEPVYRILGFREFYGLRLELSCETLEPRPDTEALVDLVLPRAQEIAGQAGTCRILDLGTGTGAIALALLSQIPAATVLAVDISVNALATARRNADILGYGHRFETRQASWFSGIAGEFDLIVSNPPYIASKVVDGLDRAVRDFDPRLALDGGPDGLDAYRAIATGAPRHLSESGMVAVEIGFDQHQSVISLFRAHGLRKIDEAKDLGGRDRALLFGIDVAASG